MGRKIWNEKTKKTSVTLVVLLLILVGEIITFRNILFNDSLFGAAYDGKLNNYFVEHWYKVFCGQESWKDLICFYPAKNVLGYSDIMLGFSLPYSVLRFFGMNMFSAFKWVLILTHVLGSYCLFYFSNKCLKLSPWASLVAVVSFSFSNGYNAMMINPQMLAVSCVPFLLIMLYYYFANWKKKRRHVFALASVAIVVLLFYTAFYVAYFVCVLAMISVLFFLVCSIFRRKNEVLWQLYRNVLAHWKEYFIYGGVAVIFMLPFIQLYLPVLQSTGGRTWEEVLAFSPGWRHLVQMNDIDIAGWDSAIYNLVSGFPIIDLFIFTIVALLAIFVKRKRERTQKEEFLDFIFFYLLLLLGFCMVMTIQVHGMSIWYIFYKFLPGASALRGIGRWLSFMTLWFGILLALYLERARDKFSWLKQWMVAIVALVVFCSNYTPQAIGTEWSVSEETAYLDLVAKPPEDCEIMYLTDREHVAKQQRNEMFLEAILQMQSWAIADRFSIKTINGYSGQEPEGWNIHPQDEDVDWEVRKWLALNGVTDDVVYAYDIGTNKWTKFEY